MTIKELVSFLSGLPPDTEVFADVNTHWGVKGKHQISFRYNIRGITYDRNLNQVILKEQS